jgi:hypothetical protein
MMDREAWLQKFRADVFAAVEARGLVSLMNDTRWTALVDGIYTRLPFPPPFQFKDVLMEEPSPESFEHDVAYHGAWQELFPYYQVEWLRVRPRYLKHQGKLVPPKLIDCTDQFVTLVRELRCPHRLDADTVWIYGHAASTAGIVTG